LHYIFITFLNIIMISTDKCLSPDVSIKSAHGFRLAMASYNESSAKKCDIMISTDKCLSPDVSIKSAHGLRIAMASYNESSAKKRRSTTPDEIPLLSSSRKSGAGAGAGEGTKVAAESELHKEVNVEDYREIYEGISDALNRSGEDVNSSEDRNIDQKGLQYAEEQKDETSDKDTDTLNTDLANDSSQAETYAELEKEMLQKLSILEKSLGIANSKTHELELSMHTQINVMNENLKIANESISNLANDQTSITCNYAGDVVDFEEKTIALSNEIQSLATKINETKGEVGRLNKETSILDEKLIEKDEKIDFEFQLDERNGHILSLSKRITSDSTSDRIDLKESEDIPTVPFRRTGSTALSIGGEKVSYQQLMEKNELLERRVRLSEDLARKAETELTNIVSKYSIEREINQREIESARIKEEKHHLIENQVRTEIDDLKRSEELYRIENKELKDDLMDTFNSNDESRKEEMKKYLNLKSFISRVISRLTTKEKNELDELEESTAPLSPSFSFGSILCFM
jgi:hypothetical protein